MCTDRSALCRAHAETIILREGKYSPLADWMLDPGDTPREQLRRRTSVLLSTARPREPVAVSILLIGGGPERESLVGTWRLLQM